MKVCNLKISAVIMMLVTAPAFAGQSVDKSWDVDENATISIENIAGNIEVRGWDRAEAHLTGELGDSVDELEINATSSSLPCIDPQATQCRWRRLALFRQP